jgi:hypothetical protein
MMVTQACNLSCHGCSNYSDLVHKGYLTWEQARLEIVPWLERVDIQDFGILGGEPLMNPDIRNWIVGLRELLPASQIRFTTNALLLEKNFDVVDLLHDIGNCVFKIAVHQKNPRIEAVIKRVYEKFNWEPVTEFGMSRHKTDNDLKFYVRRPEVFFKSYLGDYKNMRPHNSDPAESFSICPQCDCTLLYNGRMFKCSTSGLLSDTLDRVGNPNMDEWRPYIHKGISPDCSEIELTQFLDNFNKPHEMCRMCPTKKDTESLIVHLENVSVKKVKI